MHLRAIYDGLHASVTPDSKPQQPKPVKREKPLIIKGSHDSKTKKQEN